MKLLILAGGYGTRLKSVLKDKPKILAPVDNSTFLDFQIKNFVNQKIYSFIFLLHYKAIEIQSHLKRINKEYLNKLEIKIVIENKPLGTGGSILNAVKQLSLKEEFLLINGDTWIDSGFSKIRSAHSSSVAVVEVKNNRRYGSIKVDSNNNIIDFSEKKIGTFGLINSGLLKFYPNDLTNFTSETSSLEYEILPYLAKKKKLKAIKIDANFIDIGIPYDYSKFCEMIKNETN